MRGLASYILAGVVVVLAWDFVAPPAALSLALGRWPAADASPAVATQYPIQDVDRTHKGDRLKLPTTVGKRQTPAPPPSTLVGCEPLFSPLSARAAMTGRCIA